MATFVNAGLQGHRATIAQVSGVTTESAIAKG
jgi:hypothetical protein